jgi:hypothetical protein
MLIQVGYELVFRCPQETPMILMVNIHYSRASDLVIPDCLTTDPETPVTAYRHGFGNWCTWIAAPIGRIGLKSTGVVRVPRASLFANRPLPHRPVTHAKEPDQ